MINGLSKKVIIFMFFLFVASVLLLFRKVTIYSLDLEKLIENNRAFFANQETAASEQVTDANVVNNRMIDLNIFNSLFNSSSEQLLVDRNVLLKTIKFMIEERDEDDPELISFIKSLIVKTTGQPINLNDKNKVDFSQIGQSPVMDKALGEMANGFFVEAGGHDGESNSNSLYFELKRAWTGILIEPIPSYFNQIVKKNRNIFVLNACIANRRPLVAKFRLFNSLSGRMSEMDQRHQQRIDKEGNTNQKVIAYVPCFSLNSILKALNVNTIDYFSLDVEGGEYDVLQSIDFKNINIKSFTIEHNGYQEAKTKINTFLINNGYDLIKEDGQDVYFLKK